eukprot:1236015-Rhodomonas_salina.1
MNPGWQVTVVANCPRHFKLLASRSTTQAVTQCRVCPGRAAAEIGDVSAFDFAACIQYGVWTDVSITANSPVSRVSGVHLYSASSSTRWYMDMRPAAVESGPLHVPALSA